MKRFDEIDDEFSRKLAELLRLIEQLPAERQAQLRRELEDGTLGADELQKALEEGKQ